ncbi:hypothetical protein [Streptomyces sp. NPDC051577]|uniref:hypothetical protein n=1 Tax=Streptomyces sp. NPDC051577 TaxID=3155166 RepID=UPI003411F8C7
MASENVTGVETGESTEPQSAKAVDDRLIDELVSRAQAEGLQLTGEGGVGQAADEEAAGVRPRRGRDHRPPRL